MKLTASAGIPPKINASAQIRKRYDEETTTFNRLPQEGQVWVLKKDFQYFDHVNANLWPQAGQIILKEVIS
jgi:hypothetical protein